MQDIGREQTIEQRDKPNLQRFPKNTDAKYTAGLISDGGSPKFYYIVLSESVTVVFNLNSDSNMTMITKDAKLAAASVPRLAKNFTTGARD